METEMLKECKSCRICASPDLRLVVDLGSLHPSTFLAEDGEPVGPFPLELVKCAVCDLVQLRHTLDLDVSYRQYWYTSSLNQSMVDSLQDIVNTAMGFCNLRTGDTVVDIGCNDGTLLSLILDDVEKVGFDPAINLAEKAKEHCDVFINDYFDVDHVPEGLEGNVRLVTSIAMFYDLEDPVIFVKGIKKILDPQGLWVIQMMDLMSMMTTGAFDNICFEHLEYYSLDVLCRLLKEHGLRAVDVSYNDTNGGSVRVLVKHADTYIAEPSVAQALRTEAEYLAEHPVEELGTRIPEIIAETQRMVAEVSQKGPVYVLGASTKGNTLLQMCGLTHKEIGKALEVNPDKFDLRTVGTNIPIVPEAEGLADGPAGLLVLPWHFAKGLTAKMQPYLERGGCLIFPLPTPTKVSL